LELVPNEQSEGISETTSACHLPVYKHLSKVRSGQSMAWSKNLKKHPSSIGNQWKSSSFSICVPYFTLVFPMKNGDFR
jgi:hypothetical protein